MVGRKDALNVLPLDTQHVTQTKGGRKMYYDVRLVEGSSEDFPLDRQWDVELLTEETFAEGTFDSESSMGVFTDALEAFTLASELNHRR